MRRPARSGIEPLEGRQLLSNTFVVLSGGSGSGVSEGSTVVFYVSYFYDGPGAPGGSVTLSLSGSAARGVDYEILTTTVAIPAGPSPVYDPNTPPEIIFPSGGSIAVPVQVRADNAVEGPETLSVVLSGFSGLSMRPLGMPEWIDATWSQTATITITDDPPRVSIARDALADSSEELDPATGEPRPLRFGLARWGGDISQALQVFLQRGAGSTAGGGDCSLPNSVTIPAGQYGVDLEVPVTDDSTAEWTENLVVEVPSTGSYLAGGSITAYIRDNDLSIGSLPEVLLANNDDDNGNGVADMSESTLPSGDDDAVSVALGWPQELKPGCVVTIVANGPLQLYKSDGTPLGATAWTIGSGEAPPRTVLVAANGGVTQINGATLTLSATDSTVPFATTSTTATTQTTPVIVSVQYGSADATARKAADVLVGQWIPASVSAVAPEGWIGGPPTWSVTGTVYAGYHMEISQAFVIPYDAECDWSTGFYWAAGDGSTQTVTATVWLRGASLARAMRFGVYKPQASIAVQLADPLVSFSDTYVVVGGNGQAGATITAMLSIPSGFAGGELAIIQLVNMTLSWVLPDGSVVGRTTGGQYVLDGDRGMQTPLLYDTVTQVDLLGSHQVLDTPGMPWTYGSAVQAHFDAAFKAYAMFRPQGEGSNWVPLCMGTWHFELNVVVDNGVPVLCPAPQGGAADGTSATSAPYPEWQGSVQPILASPPWAL